MGVYKYNATDDELNPIAGATTFADCAIGSIIPFGGNTIPKSFLLCDGAEVSKTEYADLYAVIGDAFGTATEATNFILPDLRECAPVGAGKNITKSIGSHDRFNLGQFKDDQLQNFVISQSTRYQSNTASAGDGFIEGSVDGGTIQIKSENATTGRFGDVTRGKRLGVNFIIKAKHSAYPADMKQAVEEVMDDYQTKDLVTPITIGGTSQTTVEGALGGLNSAKLNEKRDRYIVDTRAELDTVLEAITADGSSFLGWAVPVAAGRPFSVLSQSHVSPGSRFAPHSGHTLRITFFSSFRFWVGIPGCRSSCSGVSFRSAGPSRSGNPRGFSRPRST